MGVGYRVPIGKLDVRTFRSVAQDLRRRIDSGEWPPRSRLPSEASLWTEYQVARDTLRRAKQVLCSAGLVELRPAGTYTCELPEVRVQAVSAGARIAGRMPSAEECAEQGIPEGVPVFVVTDPDGSTSVYPTHTVELSASLPRRPGLRVRV